MVAGGGYLRRHAAFHEGSNSGPGAGNCVLTSVVVCAPLPKVSGEPYLKGRVA